MGEWTVTAADASPEPDLCIPCWEHRHEDCNGQAWCDDEVGASSCFCGNEWHSVDLDDAEDRAWWERYFPDGINCHQSDAPREHWNRGAMRGARQLDYIAVCSNCPKVRGFGEDLLAREAWAQEHLRSTGHRVSFQS